VFTVLVLSVILHNLVDRLQGLHADIKLDSEEKYVESADKTREQSYRNEQRGD
jgi:hypothetical protein